MKKIPTLFERRFEGKGLVDVFAQRLKDLRIQRGLSLNQLAKDIGVTAQSLSLYENSKRTINIDLLNDIAKYFNVSADYLIGLSDVASLDTDMQAVCDYIGLDDVSVGIVKNAATTRKNVLLMINNGKVKKIMETEGVIEWQV
jgi:transcriptional regulator with XRE-family HTH domain